MKKAAIFEVELNNLAIELSRHFSELVKHQNPIVIETDDILTVYDRFSGIPYDVHPLKVTDDGIEACEVEREDKPFKIYFSNLQSIEDKILLISLMEDSMEIFKEAREYYDKFYDDKTYPNEI